MNLFFDLPDELQREIYEYDISYRDAITECFRDLKESMKYYHRVKEKMHITFMRKRLDH